MDEKETKPLTPAQIHAGHRQRLRANYLKNGADGFNDHQLLEFLLSYAIPRKDTNGLAHLLIQHFGSLENVFQATLEELCKVEGMNERIAILIRLVPDMVRRCWTNRSKIETISTTEEAADYLEPYFRGERQERIYLLSLGANDRILACDCLANGKSDRVTLEPKALVEAALRHRAKTLILAHSHPSGYPEASGEDVAVTRQCRLLLRQMDIELRDHIIFADDDYFSMAQSQGFW